jgi:cell division initiation protein
MLTPQEISGKEFVKAVFGGYDMSAVDDFLETLTGDYAALYKENAILKSKIKVLVEKVEEYRTTDDAMRMALLTAQRMSEEITTEAKKKSEEMLRQADKDVRDRLGDMKNKFAMEEDRIKALKSETSKYIKASQEIVRQYTQFLTKLEDVSSEMALPEKESEPEPLYDEVPEPAYAEGTAETAAAAAAADDLDFDIADPETDPFSKLFMVEEPVKDKKSKYDEEPEDDLEATSPRPKFDFNNLKFGSNYTGE